MKAKAGDLVFLYNSEKARFLVTYQPGKRVSTHLGEIVLPDDLEYGAAVRSSTGAVFYVLMPSTSDIAMKVRRTTTIIYPKDAGWMILEAGIGSGSKVIEVGSGSGSLTIMLARIVGPEGRVYSFERREKFLENARENVKRAGLLDRVEFALRDPAVEGFGVEDVEAVFVDVPEPWTMVPPAFEALAGGGAWISLSPNMEQVKETWRTLKSHGFVRFKAVEILEREILVREQGVRPRERMISHTGYIVSARKVNIPPEEASEIGGN